MPQDSDWTRRKLDYEPPRIDTSKAHSARVADYLLGGKDNYMPDREAAERLMKVAPSAADTVRQNRWFLHRLTRYLAEQGIRQFLELGSGIPTSPNVHEIAQQVDPAARVVYVDSDPIVAAHSNARLTSSPEGRVAYILGDMRDADAVLSAPELTGTLDLSLPTALLILSALHHLTDEEGRELLHQYVAALAPGSFLALSVATSKGDPVDIVEGAQTALGSQGIKVLIRSLTETVALFDGLELLEPGVVPVNQWRPASSDETELPGVGLHGGVARKP
jgi:O-methyltransferase involved in polyketide biosynthesis